MLAASSWPCDSLPLVLIVNGCECPSGIVIDEAKNECVAPSECTGMYTSNNCNIHSMSTLPDMYTRCPRASVDILGNVQVPVLQLIYYTSSTQKSA